jgi:hypothetical protein
MDNYDEGDHCPRVLPCGHSIGHHCLNQLIRNNTAKRCPECRGQISVNRAGDAPKNFSLLQQIHVTPATPRPSIVQNSPPNVTQREQYPKRQVPSGNAVSHPQPSPPSLTAACRDACIDADAARRLDGARRVKAQHQAEFEAAVSDESAAIIAYFDDLKAAVPLYDEELRVAVDRRDYDTAEFVSAERETLRRVIAADANPGRKAFIQGALADGIITRIRDAENNEQRRLHANWLESKTRLESQIQNLTNESNHRLDQLLREETAAASMNFFQRARELKKTFESEQCEANRSAQLLQVGGHQLMHFHTLSTCNIFE